MAGLDRSADGAGRSPDWVTGCCAEILSANDFSPALFSTDRNLSATDLSMPLGGSGWAAPVVFGCDWAAAGWFCGTPPASARDDCTAGCAVLGVEPAGTTPDVFTEVPDPEESTLDGPPSTTDAPGRGPDSVAMGAPCLPPEPGWLCCGAAWMEPD